MKKNATYSFLWHLLRWPVKFLLPTKVVCKERLPLPEKIITVSNHLSLLDVPVVGINVKGYRHFVGKKELLKSAFFRWLIKAVDAIPIDRGKADLTAMRKIVSVLKVGETITIFPEGTRNRNDESLQEVKAGAALFAIKGDAPVVAIMIYRKPKFFRKNYLYIGEPFYVAENGSRADTATVNEGALRIEEEMKKGADYLEDYVINKRWKEIKRNKKAEKKRRKLYAKEAKRAVKAIKKGMAK
jgi:1-acyl-sn-glycerol-3-phosphate acyltransferase